MTSAGLVVTDSIPAEDALLATAVPLDRRANPATRKLETANAGPKRPDESATNANRGTITSQLVLVVLLATAIRMGLTVVTVMILANVPVNPLLLDRNAASARKIATTWPQAAYPVRPAIHLFKNAYALCVKN